mmetsp:Transcript_6611/g.11084  ORF Transcript_6611/g.11084 Transcript_6611/m.11084 type:complete len:270 (+) Transcript_6611:72-881(+)
MPNGTIKLRCCKRTHATGYTTTTRHATGRGRQEQQPHKHARAQSQAQYLQLNFVLLGNNRRSLHRRGLCRRGLAIGNSEVGDEFVKPRGVDGLLFNESRGQLVEQAAVVVEQLAAPLVGLVHDQLHLPVDAHLRLLRRHFGGVVARVGRLPRRLPKLVACEPPLRHHVARQARHLLQVRGRSRGDVLHAVPNLLRDSPAERHHEAGLEVCPRVHAAVLLLVGRQEEREPPRAVGARNDGNLAHFVEAGGQGGSERVAGLVVGHQLLAVF